MSDNIANNAQYAFVKEYVGKDSENYYENKTEPAICYGCKCLGAPHIDKQGIDKILKNIVAVHIQVYISLTDKGSKKYGKGYRARQKNYIVATNKWLFCVLSFCFVK